MSRNVLLGLVFSSTLALVALPATATTMPLADITAGSRIATLGFSDLTLHASADWAPGGLLSGWSFGLAGGVDYAKPTRRDSNHMVAARIARRIWGSAPYFTVGLVVSGGVNLVDPGPAPPDPLEQSFYSEFLPWVQPAVAVSFRIPEFEAFWFRASLGPVIGRFTAGVLTMPWIVPNFEFAYRFAPNQEAVLGGGYATPYGLAWRVAY